jgi:hypothetical protein
MVPGVANELPPIFKFLPLVKIISHTLEAEDTFISNENILTFNKGQTGGDEATSASTIGFELSQLPNEKLIPFISNLIHHFMVNL